jgi:hypothetical protein
VPREEEEMEATLVLVGEAAAERKKQAPTGEDCLSAMMATRRGQPLREDEDGAQLSGDGAARRGLGEDGNGMAVARDSPHRRRWRQRCRFPSIEPIHGRLRGIW